MSCDVLAMCPEGVRGLSPYQPGKPVAELERELGISGIIKLASNENPLGPSPRAVAAAQQALIDGARYPDGNGFALKQALSRRLGVAPEQITLGNGSNDILELVARAWLHRDCAAMYSEHSFAVYPLVTQATGAMHQVVPAQHYGHDLAAMARDVTDATRVVFLANPNNPTGTWFARDELQAFLQVVPEQLIVVLDEAYCEYVDEHTYPDGLELLDDFPNLIVTRTFSKAWGLAGLRVGYALSSPEIADVLNRLRQPFNVNACALAAAEAVLDDSEYLQASIDVNDLGLDRLAEGFEDLGLEFIPSVANFIAVDMGREGVSLYQALLQEGVIVRPVANYAMPNHLRVSVGLPQENECFLDALQRVLSR